jgi:hypothetical protein
MRNLFSASSGRLLIAALLSLCLCGLFPLWVWAEAPAWWTERGVLDPEATADDYAVVNQGQLKHIAKQAYSEFVDKLPNGPGPVLTAMWGSPTPGSDDYLAINTGQLKHVAQPFYDRLIAEGMATSYPWGSAADDYALANIGQVKNLFSFELPSTPVVVDTDQDGIPDDQEAAAGTDPKKYSSGDNGAPDGWWISHELSPFSSITHDTDGDGRPDVSEFLEGTNPRTPDVAPNPTVGAPAAPTEVRADTLSGSRYRVLWQNNAAVLLGNIVERSVDGGAVWVTVGVVGPAVTEFTDATAESGLSYFYRVVAYN